MFYSVSERMKQWFFPFLVGKLIFGGPTGKQAQKRQNLMFSQTGKRQTTWASMPLNNAQTCTKPYPKNRKEPSLDLDGDSELMEPFRHGQSVVSRICNQLRVLDL